MATSRARSSFAALGRIVTIGTVLDTSDPIVRQYPALFEADASAPVVEQATAAPGEVRTTPRKTAARKASAKPKG